MYQNYIYELGIPNFNRIGLIMRLTTLILIATFMQVSATGFAQKISMSKSNAPLKEVLKKLRTQSGYNFVYTDDLLAMSKSVNIKVYEAELEDVLVEIFNKQPLTFSINKNTITIREKLKSASKELRTSLEAVDIVVKGRVMDTKGETLVGVSVKVKGTSSGTTTDINGNYTLNLANPNSTLVFSYIGFITQEISVNNRSVIEVILIENNSSLNEVVVVGYGSVKKTDITGAVSQITAEAITATPIVALDRALQGRVAGVQVNTNSARPGGSNTIRIRGSGSVNAGNEPLYVIDGFPTTNLNSINPLDIATLDILKDASATAIYGSRGSNGVVLITTKRGKAGKSSIEFNSYYGVQSARRTIPVLNGQEYAEFLNEARINAGGVAFFDGSSPDRPVPSTIGAGTDWQDVIFQDAPLQSYQLSLSGGETKTRYSISANLYDQKGLILNSGFKRATLRTNIDRDISDRVKTGLSLQGAFVNSLSASTEAINHRSNLTSAALNFVPIYSPFDPSGNYSRDVLNLNPFPTDNPLALANEITDISRGFRVFTNVFAEVKVLDDLTFRTTWGADLNNNRFNNYNSRRLLLSSNIGNAAVGSDQSSTWQTENTLNYAKTFKEKHNLNFLMGITYQKDKYDFAQARAAGFNSDFAKFNNLSAASTLLPSVSSVSESSLLSYLSRLNYGFDNRYLLTLTLRRDGSSRFSPNKKFGNFPSGAFAWRVMNEKFMSDQKIFSDLKFRVSYGITGNQSIGDYRFLASLNNFSYAFNGIPVVGSSPNGVSNLDLEWEKNQQFDVGVDFSVLRDRIQFTADYYRKKTYDLLYDINLPFSSGYSTALSNIGSVENKGFEFSLNTKNVAAENFQWESSFNISFNNNKVLSLDGRDQILAGVGNGDLQINNPILLKVGEPLGNFYGRVMDGIFQNTAEIANSAQKTAKPGDIRYQDLNGDGIINDNDRSVIGNGYAKFFGGLDNTFIFKNFDLNIFLQGSFGNEILNLSRLELYSLNGQNQAREVVNRWTPTNASNSIPRANIAGGQKILSSFLIENGSYLRAKNISLGYNLSPSLIKKMSLQSARIYISGQNQLTFTKYKGFDPEVSYQGTSATSQGIDLGAYPNSKTILLGIDAKF